MLWVLQFQRSFAIFDMQNLGLEWLRNTQVGPRTPEPRTAEPAICGDFSGWG